MWGYPGTTPLAPQRHVSSGYSPVLHQLRKYTRPRISKDKSNNVPNLRRVKRVWIPRVRYFYRPLTARVDKWPTTIQTASKPSAFPSSLRQKRSEIQTVDAEDIETWAETAYECANCKNPKMLP